MSEKQLTKMPIYKETVTVGRTNKNYKKYFFLTVLAIAGKCCFRLRIIDGATSQVIRKLSRGTPLLFLYNGWLKKIVKTPMTENLLTVKLN